MFKKIALAALLVASSSFAAWDYYHLPEAGKGTVKGQFFYDSDDPWSQWGLNVGGRYILVPNLELSLQSFGYRSWETDGSDGAGFTDLTLGARYAVMPIVNIFLDLNLPIGSNDVSDRLSFTLGGQFSQELVPNLVLGTEAGLYWGFKRHDFEPGLVMNLAAELGYTIPAYGLTPFVGLELKYKLTDDEGYNWEDNAGDNSICLWLGAAYAISSEMAVDGKLKVRSGDSSEHLDGDAVGIEVNFYYNF